MKTRCIQSAILLTGVSLSLVLGLRAEEKRAIKPEDLVDIRGVSDPQISPDGKRVAFVVSEPVEPGKPDKPRDTNIWVVPADGSEPARPFATSPKGDTSPRWSPDSRYLAFLSNRGQPVGEEKEAKNQLFLMRTDGGEAEQLTALKGEVLAFRWSPDGKMIAFSTFIKAGYDVYLIKDVAAKGVNGVLTPTDFALGKIVATSSSVGGFWPLTSLQVP